MPKVQANNFIFSIHYRILRHTLFWLCWLLGWSCFWTFFGTRSSEVFIRIALYIPIFIIYSYPVSHMAVPKLLLKGKYLTFLFFILFWLVVGWYMNVYFVNYIFIPTAQQLNLPSGDESSGLGFHCMLISAACISALSLLKYWIKKQQEWLSAEREKVNVQLQLLKGQLHPHFLFNTLNNMYGLALHSSPKTPQMILKLSSLLSYMLYECKGEHVLLEKEMEVMKNYIELEKERYGEHIDISVNIAGDIEDKYLAPLLILPFLENAFKHGTSEQIGRPWMSVDISVKSNVLKCKVINSKNELVSYNDNGVGVENVRKRLELLYPGNYTLKLTNEGDFYVVSLVLVLHEKPDKVMADVIQNEHYKIPDHENALSFSR